MDIEDENSEKVPKENKPKKAKVNVFFQSTIGPSQRSEKMLLTLEAPVMDFTCWENVGSRGYFR